MTGPVIGRPLPPRSVGGKPMAVVLGAYLADQQTNVEQVWRELDRAGRYQVRQHWASVGTAGTVPVPTTLALADRVPKYAAINALLNHADLDTAEYVVVCDDDIGLPIGFVDSFLDVQSRLGFALAQPARSPDSTGDHSIVTQQQEILARQTMFVETGPCFSMHRSIFGLMLPFDLASPMGWGYEYVWAHRLAARGLRMGVVDATPVTHTIRTVGAYYDRGQAYQAQQNFLAAHDHLGEQACHRVLRVFPLPAERGCPPDGTGRDIRRHPPLPRQR